MVVWGAKIFTIERNVNVIVQFATYIVTKQWAAWLQERQAKSLHQSVTCMCHSSGCVREGVKDI